MLISDLFRISHYKLVANEFKKKGSSLVNFISINTNNLIFMFKCCNFSKKLTIKCLNYVFPLYHTSNSLETQCNNLLTSVKEQEKFLKHSQLDHLHKKSMLLG